MTRQVIIDREMIDDVWAEFRDRVLEGLDKGAISHSPAQEAMAKMFFVYGMGAAFSWAHGAGEAARSLEEFRGFVDGLVVGANGTLKDITYEAMTMGESQTRGH